MHVNLELRSFKINMKNLKFRICFTFLLATLVCSLNSFGQQAVKYKVAVFAPLYLDSAFDSNFDYRFSKNNFPKYISPGLEFYEGVQLALDSLNNAKTPLEVFIYDTKSTRETVSQQLNRSELNDVQLLIAYATNPDLKIFADAGLKKNIPVGPLKIFAGITLPIRSKKK